MVVTPVVVALGLAAVASWFYRSEKFMTRLPGILALAMQKKGKPLMDQRVTGLELA